MLQGGWETTRWPYLGSVEAWSLFGVGFHLCGHLCPISSANDFHPARSALDAAAGQNRKYAFLADRFIFAPVAVKTTGVWDPSNLRLVRELGVRIAARRGRLHFCCSVCHLPFNVAMLRLCWVRCHRGRSWMSCFFFDDFNF